MRALGRVCFLCASLVCTGVALGAPKLDAHQKYQLAARLHDQGDYEAALASLEEGLAIAPKDLPLLSLKGAVLLELHDYPAALAAYQAYLDTGARGQNRRAVEAIVDKLRAVQSTFLDIAVANGPATVYLGSKSQGVFCTAAPSCHHGILPGDYRVIAERPGFERWTGRVTVAADHSEALAVTLVEKPSLLTIRVAQPGAQIAVDDAPYAAPTTVAAGSHRVEVSLAGYAAAQLQVTAHEGKPVELEVGLTPIVPIRVEPRDAILVLDDRPAAIQDGGLAIAAGRHVLVARAPGFRDRRIEIPAERAADYQLSVELSRVAVAPTAAPPVADAGPSTARVRRIAGIAIAAAGGVAIGVGFVFGAKARSTHDAASALCGPDLVCDSRTDFDRAHQLVVDARSQATIATVVTAAGAAAIATGVIVWLTAPAERPRQTARVVPVLNSDGAGFAVAGRF